MGVRSGYCSSHSAALNSREPASKTVGPALDEIATTSGGAGGGKTVDLGEMGRSRSRSKSPSRRRHKSKHSRKRSKSREKHSNNKYSDKPKERSSKSRCVSRSAHRSARREISIFLYVRPSCRTSCVYDVFATMEKYRGSANYRVSYCRAVNPWFCIRASATFDLTINLYFGN